MTNKLSPLTYNQKFSAQFLAADESNLDLLLDKIQELHCAIGIDSAVLGRKRIQKFKYNNEINTKFFTKDGIGLDGLKSELNEIFQGTIKWNSPNAAFNITASPLLNTVAVSTITNLLNPNCLWDITSGKFILAEKKIVRLLGEKVFNISDSDGLSVFGGKGTLLYAVKVGLGNCDIGHKQRGLQGKYAVIVSERAHYSVADVCDYAGLGVDSLITVPTTSDGEMDYDILETFMDKAVAEGIKISAIICNGGITIDFCIDNAEKIRNICSAIEKRYGLSYKIHIHGDITFGWPWMFINEKKLIEHGTFESKNILKIRDKLIHMNMVDSIGVDFHKMCLCPYNSSFFVVKDKERLDLLGGFIKLKCDGNYGTSHPHYASIENSKSGTGIISAYTALLTLGENGITDYLLYLMNVKEKYKQLINTKFGHVFKILNPDSLGFELVIGVSVNGRDFNKNDYMRLCDKLWYSDNNLLMISHILEYKCDWANVPAILIYSMSPHADEESCNVLLKNLEIECIVVANNNAEEFELQSIFIPK